ncbi:hypothetical protein LPY66_04780 [Dehalobacter sp. DCM]|nr:hypothetical protein LPY66_04780 [Dehalobacter sp. DCM]
MEPFQQRIFDRFLWGTQGTKAIRTAGSKAENGNFVALLIEPTSHL